jgi:hypothetical protein
MTLKTPTTADIARFRAVADDILTQTCTVTRNTPSSDSAGGWTDSWATVSSSTPCRLAVRGVIITHDLVRSSERLMAGLDYTLKLAYDADIARGDRVTIDSVTYQIESVWDDHQWMTVKRCKLSKVY